MMARLLVGAILLLGAPAAAVAQITVHAERPLTSATAEQFEMSDAGGRTHVHVWPAIFNAAGILFVLGDPDRAELLAEHRPRDVVVVSVQPSSSAGRSATDVRALLAELSPFIDERYGGGRRALYGRGANADVVLQVARTGTSQLGGYVLDGPSATAANGIALRDFRRTKHPQTALILVGEPPVLALKMEPAVRGGPPPPPVYPPGLFDAEVRLRAGAPPDETVAFDAIFSTVTYRGPSPPPPVARERRWPGSVVPVCFSARPSDAPYLDVIKQAARVWEGDSALRFDFKATCAGLQGLQGDAYVLAKVTHQLGAFSSASHLGSALSGGGLLRFNTVYGSQDAICGVNGTHGPQKCFFADAVHELGHALGFVHDHVSVNAPSCEGRVISREAVDGAMTYYDPGSVMNYCNRARWDGAPSAADRCSVQASYPAANAAVPTERDCAALIRAAGPRPQHPPISISNSGRHWASLSPRGTRRLRPGDAGRLR